MHDRAVTTIVIFFSVCIFSGIALAQPGDPPLEQWIATQTKDGKSANIRYHADHTFELNGEDPLNHKGADGRAARYSRPGIWWRSSPDAEASVCWLTNPAPSGKTYHQHCVPAGRGIGEARFYTK